MSGSCKDVAELVRRLSSDEFGCTVAPTQKGHWKVTRSGRQGSVVLSKTPRGKHVLKAMRRDLRNILDIDL